MATVKKWLAFDVGCIECGASSGVIGTFRTEQEAKDACDALYENPGAFLGEQHSYEVFNLERVSSSAVEARTNV